MGALDTFRIVLWIFVTIFQLVSSSTAVNKTLKDLCPLNCSCNHENPVSLKIECLNGHNDYAQSMTSQIDAILATTDNLQVLEINNYFFTEILSEMCYKDSLMHINLDRNRLEALPNGCLVRLRNLVAFSAAHNLIRNLQVSCCICLQLQSLIHFC